MMSPFTPSGEIARWRILYAELVKVPVGGVFSYEEMGRLLGLHPDDDRHAIQMAFRRAARELLQVDLRSAQSVPNQGYQVVEPSGKLEIARRYQGRAVRAVRRGQEHIHFTDLDQLDDPTRAVFEAMAWKFQAQDEAIHRLDVRQRRHERQLQAAIRNHEETAAQLTQLQERLSRVEAATSADEAADQPQT